MPNFLKISLNLYFISIALFSIGVGIFPMSSYVDKIKWKLSCKIPSERILCVLWKLYLLNYVSRLGKLCKQNRCWNKFSSRIYVDSIYSTFVYLSIIPSKSILLFGFEYAFSNAYESWMLRYIQMSLLKWITKSK